LDKIHIGLIPDGNRRYMKKHGIFSLMDSYRAGINKFYDFLEWSMKRGVKEVTIYALSMENIKNRGKRETDTLYTVFAEQAEKALYDKRIHKNRIHINICGDKQYLINKNATLGRKLVDSLEKLEAATKKYSDFTLNFAMAYGGRQEIINAAKTALAHGDELDEDSIRKYLWVKDDPEIVIRTAEDRLSNFLLWQAAYAEIYFVDKFWQEFTEKDLDGILADYHSRERRFGK
jgi:tritrans,polycis-undecaprenyl-diphosphate synthase [geranylgeranyl-diphosphate specific]